MNLASAIEQAMLQAAIQGLAYRVLPQLSPEGVACCRLEAIENLCAPTPIPSLTVYPVGLVVDHGLAEHLASLPQLQAA